MPLVIKDRDGNKVEYGEVTVAGRTCAGCILILLLAIVGACYLIGGLVDLLA